MHGRPFRLSPIQGRPGRPPTARGERPHTDEICAQLATGFLAPPKASSIQPPASSGTNAEGEGADFDCFLCFAPRQVKAGWPRQSASRNHVAETPFQQAPEGYESSVILQLGDLRASDFQEGAIEELLDVGHRVCFD